MKLVRGIFKIIKWFVRLYLIIDGLLLMLLGYGRLLDECAKKHAYSPLDNFELYCEICYDLTRKSIKSFREWFN